MRKPSVLIKSINQRVGVLLIVFLAVSVVSTSYSSVSSNATVSSRGLLNYSQISATAPHFGWGGYILTKAEVIPLLDKLKSAGWNVLRYEARPKWLYGTSSHNLNYEILDHLVSEAKKRYMVVYIDPEHNYPPDAYLSGHVSGWIQDLTTVGLRYNNRTNVVLEIVNEYTGADQVSLYNQGIRGIRANGVTLPLHVNFWWNQKTVALDDPLNNYSVGRHFYGDVGDSYNPSTPIDFEKAVRESGVGNAMYSYFQSQSTYYIQEAKRLGIRFVVTELGGSTTYKYSVGNLAFVMKFLELAKQYGVTVMVFRVGQYGDYNIYYQKARDYFNRVFWTP